MPIHLKVGPGDVAERVIAVGDPARARLIASMLDGARLVNEHRGFITFTGRYGGVDVTVATHGIGGPSAAIVFEELWQSGAKLIVRLGTAGSLRRDVGLGDVVVPNGAGYNVGGLYGQYIGHSIAYPAVPDYGLLRAITESLERAGVAYRVGPVYSSDAFYAEEDLASRLGGQFLAVEMECATLFILSMLRGFRAAATLVISNSLLERGRFLSAEELEPTVRRVAKALLEALATT